MPTRRNTLRFDDFEVDLAAGQLLKGGDTVKLREKSFQVLAALLERAGEVVTRDELRRRLWPEDVFVDFDNNLNSAVARLREALGESSGGSSYIETLPKHGYRFTGRVFGAPPTVEADGTVKSRLLVLPFAVLGDSPEAYLGEAITDEVITDLARLPTNRLAVIARTTAVHYTGTDKDIATIRAELAVDYVVEGSVRPRGDRIGVNAQLIRATDQTHLWAERYDSSAADLFALSGCIADAIVANIEGAGQQSQGRVTSGTTRRNQPTADLAAYREYLRGRDELSRLSAASLSRAQRHFEAAIARDPAFALAEHALADTYWWLAYLGFRRPTEAFSAGVLHAVRAIELDNSLAEVHALLAQYHKQLHYNWPEVERGMARALALDPNSPTVRTSYAWNLLMPYGRLDEASAELEKALDVDPLSTDTRVALSITLLLAKHYDRAFDEVRRTLAIDSKIGWAHLVEGAGHLYQGRATEAIAAHRRAVEASGGAAPMLAWLGMSLALTGQTAEARDLLARLQAASGSGDYVPATSFAWIHIGLKEIDTAFEWLGRAVEERDQFIMPIRSYGFLAPLRADPRFNELLRRMNLAEVPAARTPGAPSAR